MSDMYEHGFPERGVLDWFAEQIAATQWRLYWLAQSHLALLDMRDQREADDEHRDCHPEFHRCDGGGPGLAAQYEDQQR